MFHDAHRHGIYQRIAPVGILEIDLPGHSGNAQTIAVVADTLDNSGKQVFDAVGILARKLAKTQGIERGNGPRAHGENVAHDAAHARCRALVGLDRRGMVVALYLKGDRPALANVDDPGVLLSRDRKAALPLLGKSLEYRDGVLVRAVLGPHDRIDAQFGIQRCAAKHLADLLVFLGR